MECFVQITPTLRPKRYNFRDKLVQHSGQNAPSFGTKSSNYTGIKTAAPIHIGAVFCRLHPATDIINLK